MADRSAADMRYAAFLSYSHKDAAAARWLHRKLEAYRIPKRLIGSAGRHGPVPARLTPIFRDREELPAAGDLSETVRAALAASDALIILCSPNAAASPWVGREIAVYRELHPGRPVYAAIVAGEPAEAFPAELTAGGKIEPLAADLRKEGDGRRLGLLKLVAGLAGLNLDALVQRDAARRMRTVTAVTAGALAAMLVMAVMTTLALRARAEADRQRAEAEGLVEFMLTDLREGLRKVGRLDLHGTVNRRAIAYYAAQGDPGTLPDDSVKRRARVLLAMGEDDEKRGDGASALARFKEAHASTAESLERNPNDAEAVFAHSQSEYWLGYYAYLTQDWRRTGSHWQGYKRLADRLVAMDGTNREWLREAALAQGNLCTLAISMKAEPSRSVKICEEGVARMRRLHALMPDDQRTNQDLGNRLAWLGGAWKAAGHHEKALALFLEQEKLLEPLVRREPGDAHLLDQWMRTLLAIAEHLDAMGQRDKAMDYNLKARAVAERLIKLDPQNKRWRKWLNRLVEL